MFAAIPEIAWWALGALGIGVAAKQAGQGVDAASNGAVKFAAAGAVAYLLVKKVLK